MTEDAKMYRSFYRSAAWRRMSQAKLAAVEYKCEAKLPGCTGLAVEVHHIKPIQTPEGWALRLDADNLRAVCVHCHNRAHKR
jgi:5-methylcytosine-specific restriction endonuclease McrA